MASNSGGTGGGGEASQPLIPHSSSNQASAFQQQGQVDWVTLTGSTVQFSIDVLARLSHAGVEGLTLAVVHSMLSPLNLGVVGEQRVQTAISSLRAFSSFNTLLTFGFGVKHIIRVMAESAEGLSCVGLCGCLSEVYGSEMSARVLRELFMIHNPPSRLRPSLKQWICLVQACEGALATSTFGITFHQLSKLCFAAGVPSKRGAAEPHQLALALKDLMKISSNTISKVTFIGGAECAWLAAVAHWLLNLDVEIRDFSTHDVLYRAGKLDSHSTLFEPSVVVMYDLNQTTSKSLQVLGRCHLIPSGASLFQPDPSGHILSCGRVPWAEILNASFGSRFKRLVQDSTICTIAGTAFGLLARFGEASARGSLCVEENIRAGWQYVPTNRSGYGRGLCATLRSIFPEIEAFSGFVVAMERRVEQDQPDETAKDEYNLHLRDIGLYCQCRLCTSYEVDTTTFCLVVLLETLYNIAKFMSCVSLAVEVLPTRSGIEELYWRCAYNRSGWRRKYSASRTFQSLEGLTKPDLDLWGFSNSISSLPMTSLFVSPVLLFTGRMPAVFDRNVSALASDGLTIALQILYNPTDDLEELTVVTIAPGKIEFDESSYSEICDSIERGNPPQKHNYEAKSVSTVDDLSTAVMEDSGSLKIDCKMLVEESVAKGNVKLVAAYKLSTPEGYFLIKPGETTEKLREASIGPNCHGNMCTTPLSHESCRLVNGEGIFHDGSTGQLPASDKVFLRVLPKSVLSRWIALSQGLATYSQQGHEQHTILQQNQCIRCCLNKAFSVTAVRPMSGAVGGSNFEDEKRCAVILKNLNFG